MINIWFWQLIVSPHMADLAVSLARLGCNVTYVAQQEMSKDRAMQGWSSPSLQNVTLQFINCKDAALQLVALAPLDSIHICQGIRANDLIGVVQGALIRRGMQQWVIMETVDDSGLRGIIKRALYRLIFRLKKNSLMGVLATGHSTANWVIKRGMPSDRVYSFAYFLPNNKKPEILGHPQSEPFRFIYAGRLIPLKRIDWIINSLANIKDFSFELWIVGAGVQEYQLRSLANEKLGDKVRWFGQLPLPDVPAVMAQADCLILPSEHDGWGAVASEALMVGTPVICSDACGVAGVVKNSGKGGVFPVNDINSLEKLLHLQLKIGAIDTQNRSRLIAWASCLSSDTGAKYLYEILTRNNTESVRTPWIKSNHENARN